MALHPYRDKNRAGLRFVSVGTSLMLVAAAIVGFPTVSHAAAPAPDVAAFSYTGHAETYPIPAGVDRIFFVAAGGAGGSSSLLNGGFGSVVSGILDVSSIDELSVRVGQQPTTSVGGFNGGGSGGAGSSYTGFGGGGATDVRAGGEDLDDRIIVAGGGGGTASGIGGNGGAPNGSDGTNSGNSTAGGGATQSTGGAAGTSVGAATQASGGSEAQGGNGATDTSTVSGGGGGGGYFGGGGGGVDSNLSGASGGGGGSSFASTTLVSSPSFQVGNLLGNGYLWIVPLAANSFVANAPTTAQYTAPVTGAHEVLLVGGSGGRARGMYLGQKPGAGGAVRFTTQLTNGSIYDVNVGGAGEPATGATGGTGGNNGGGGGGDGTASSTATNGGSGGGGATDLRPDGGNESSRLGVAGGGGGAPTSGIGGSGGNPATDGAFSTSGGKAGTASTPGTGGTGTVAGSDASGAIGGGGGGGTGRNVTGGGGGGGGYTGGGGGAAGAQNGGGGGGGGFSYVPGPATNVSYPSLANTSSGFAIITPSTTAGPLSFTATDFGSATVNVPQNLSVTVTNDGTGDAIPSAITPAGSGIALNATAPGSCVVGQAINPGDDCTVALVWTPTAAGTLTGASLTIAYPDGADPDISTRLTGTANSSSGGQSQKPVGRCVLATARMPASGIKRLQRPNCHTSANQRIGTKLKFTARRGDIRAPRLVCKVGRQLVSTKNAPASYGRGAKYCARGTLLLITYKRPGRVTITWTAPKTAKYKAYLKVVTFRTASRTILHKRSTSS